MPVLLSSKQKEFLKELTDKDRDFDSKDSFSKFRLNRVGCTLTLIKSLCDDYVKKAEQNSQSQIYFIKISNACAYLIDSWKNQEKWLDPQKKIPKSVRRDMVDLSTELKSAGNAKFKLTLGTPFLSCGPIQKRFLVLADNLDNTIAAWDRENWFNK